jgi:uncharacterized protein YxeA
MKKVLMVLIALIFVGCATDGLYEVSKSVYKGGKSVVKANKDLINDKTLKSLKKVDRVATGYDTIRSEVRKTTDKKKPLLVDINSTKIQ